MDHSFSETDISMSPSQILERLQMLRHMQLIQRGKLQKQRLRYDSTEQSTTATEIVSHFSNNTSYNTFRSLLDSSRDENDSPGKSDLNLSQRISSQNIMEGVSVLNLSQDSEFLTNSPVPSKNTLTQSVMQVDQGREPNNSKFDISQKRISLDEMPILSPRKDFEALVIQKLQTEKANKDTNMKPEHVTKCMSETETTKIKRPYLKRGEGMSRFGIQKENFVIQNTKSLPWRQKNGSKTKQISKSKLKNSRNMSSNKSDNIQILETEVIKVQPKDINLNKDVTSNINVVSQPVNYNPPHDEQTQSNKNEKNECMYPKISPNPHLNILDNSKRSGLESKGKTWAAVLSKEQSDFLRQLKQSNYYKNFHSPAKSTISDLSCDEYNIKTKQEMEVAEQNLFDLIEKKVSHDSFDLRNSFFNRFLGNIDTSGESTPLILKKCFSDNPRLNHLSPANIGNLRCNTSCSDVGNCNSECTECSETCSSVSSCCSCKTVTQNDFSPISVSKETLKAPDKKGPSTKEEKIPKPKIDNCQDDSVIKNEFNVNMEEMNAKLIATSDLLKDRLKELEDEIEIFRRENANLNKIREELDSERQKFYEEKKNFEQKFTEDKILSEYYLAEEKEKLQKQKQLYERYVRDIRGRLNKKEKDETLNLKKEIQELKEEIRTKEAKSTSIIARLRNQIKLIEKEKKSIEEQAEKLKKENKRIQHSNEITRRLSNLKYLESINKKLSNMTNKNTQVDINHDPDIKYKSYSIERQSRLKTVEPTNKNMSRPRAKSVPNLNVTSRYAKYFSQKDSLSDMGKQNLINIENVICDNELSDLEDTGTLDHLEDHNTSDSDDNGLEKIYNERFKDTLSTKSKKERSSRLDSPDSTEKLDCQQNPSDFFIRKTKNSIDKLKPLSDSSPSYRQSLGSSSNSFSSNRMSSGSTCNKSIESQEGKENFNSNIDVGEIKSKYTAPTFNKHNSSPHGSTIPINKELYCDSRLIPSPEPVLSRSNSSKTNLNPTEITKPDGSRELRFPNGNVKIMSADGKYSKFTYYNGDVKENFYKEGKIKYFYAETKTYHTSHADGLEVLEFSDGQIEKRYKDGSTEIRLPNGSIRYFDPKNEHVQEEWRFPDGATLTVSASGEKRIKFANGQIEVHAKDHKRREFPDGTVKLVYNDGTSETRYASGRIRIKDKHGNLIMDSAPD